MLPSGRDYLKSLSNPVVVEVGKSVRKIESEMKRYGNGSRAIIRVTRGRRGHVFIAENMRGKTVYVDPQTNKRYSKLSLSRVSKAAVIRIDDQQFTDYARNAFTRERV